MAKKAKSYKILNVNNKRVQESVTSWMKSEKLSKSTASRKIGYSYQYFCNMLSGNSKISEAAAIKLLFHSGLSKPIAKKTKVSKAAKKPHTTVIDNGNI